MQCIDWRLRALWYNPSLSKISFVNREEMVGKSGQSSQKAVSIINEKSQSQDFDQGVDVVHAYEIVLKKYGEAMLRIGRLEAQMRDLSMGKDKDDGNADQVATEVAKETAFSMDEQSQGIVSSDLERERMLMRKKEEEIVQLRDQIASLISRLDRAESAEKDKSTRPKRRSKNSSKLGWGFWRRGRRR